jgi:hypothetical protein
LMRDIGFDFYWFDPFADNLSRKDLNIHPIQRK